MALVKLYWLSGGSTWVKVQDDTSTGTPINFGTVNTGSESPAQALRLQVDSGYQSISVIPPYEQISVTPSGTHASWFQLTRDNGGSPSGTWLSGGAAYTITSGAEIEGSATTGHPFWAKIAIPPGTPTTAGITDTTLRVLSYVTTDFQVSSISPSTGGVLSSSGNITVTFNKLVNTSAATTSHFVLKNSTGGTIAYSSAWTPNAATIVIDPTPTLPDDTYYIVISKNLVDYEGCALSETVDYTTSAAQWTVSAPDSTPPGTVTITGCTSAVTDSINVGWSSAADNVGVTSYEYFYTTGTSAPPTTPAATTAAASGFVSGIASTARTATQGGLQAGTLYHFYMKARDAAGNRSASWSSSAGTTIADTAVPGTVTMNYATGVAAGQIRFAWNAATDNVGVQYYEYYYNTDNATPPASPAATGATTTTGYTTGIGAATLSALATGLTAGGTYYFRVKARDAAGNRSSSWGSSVNAIASVPDTEAPSLVTNVTLTGIAASSGALNWTAATDNVAVTSYQYLRVADSSATPVNGTAATVSGIPNSPTTTGVTFPANNTYYYWMKAADAAGNLSSAWAGSTTNAWRLGIPTLSVTSATSASITVDVGSVYAATAYDLQYKATTAAPGAFVTSANVGTGAETLSGLTSGLQYDIQARARTATVTGAWSSTVNGTPQGATTSILLDAGFENGTIGQNLSTGVWSYVAAITGVYASGSSPAGSKHANVNCGGWNDLQLSSSTISSISGLGWASVGTSSEVQWWLKLVDTNPVMYFNVIGITTGGSTNPIAQILCDSAMTLGFVQPDQWPALGEVWWEDTEWAYAPVYPSSWTHFKMVVNWSTHQWSLSQWSASASAWQQLGNSTQGPALISFTTTGQTWQSRIHSITTNSVSGQTSYDHIAIYRDPT